MGKKILKNRILVVFEPLTYETYKTPIWMFFEIFSHETNKTQAKKKKN